MLHLEPLLSGICSSESIFSPMQYLSHGHHQGRGVAQALELAPLNICFRGVPCSSLSVSGWWKIEYSHL